MILIDSVLFLFMSSWVPGLALFDPSSSKSGPACHQFTALNHGLWHALCQPQLVQLAAFMSMLHLLVAQGKKRQQETNGNSFSPLVAFPSKATPSRTRHGRESTFWLEKCFDACTPFARSQKLPTLLTPQDNRAKPSLRLSQSVPQWCTMHSECAIHNLRSVGAPAFSNTQTHSLS